jgi:cyclic pyranopterin phosphate synthase
MTREGGAGVPLPMPSVRRPDPAPALPGDGLVDGFGRVHTDLRLSLTDRCNLRCTYCMPAEGLPWLPKPELLTDDELVRLVACGGQAGRAQRALTAASRCCARDCPASWRRLAALGVSLSVTSNGLGLSKLAQAWADADLSRVNVSLDTLRPERSPP